MTRLRTFAVALSLGAAAACSEQAAMPDNPAAPSAVGATSAKPGADSVAVTSTLQGNPGGAFDIASDGSGGYTNSSILTSAIGSTGVWHLDLRNRNNTRTVYLNLGTSGLTGNHKVFMYIGCNFPNWATPGWPDGQNLLQMPTNTPTTCPLAAQFDKNGQRYLLRMNSNQDNGTDNVTVTRQVAGPVTTWQIQPTGAKRAGLYLQGKGNADLELQEVYNMSFEITLTNP